MTFISGSRRLTGNDHGKRSRKTGMLGGSWRVPSIARVRRVSSTTAMPHTRHLLRETKCLHAHTSGTRRLKPEHKERDVCFRSDLAAAASDTRYGQRCVAPMRELEQHPPRVHWGLSTAPLPSSMSWGYLSRYALGSAWLRGAAPARGPAEEQKIAEYCGEEKAAARLEKRIKKTSEKLDKKLRRELGLGGASVSGGAYLGETRGMMCGVRALGGSAPSAWLLEGQVSGLNDVRPAEEPQIQTPSVFTLSCRIWCSHIDKDKHVGRLVIERTSWY